MIIGSASQGLVPMPLYPANFWQMSALLLRWGEGSFLEVKSHPSIVDWRGMDFGSLDLGSNLRSPNLQGIWPWAISTTSLSHRFPPTSTDLVQSLPPLFFLFIHSASKISPPGLLFSLPRTCTEHYSWRRSLRLPPSFYRWGNWSTEKRSDFSKITQWINNGRV